MSTNGVTPPTLGSLAELRGEIIAANNHFQCHVDAQQKLFLERVALLQRTFEELVPQPMCFVLPSDGLADWIVAVLSGEAGLTFDGLAHEHRISAPQLTTAPSPDDSSVVLLEAIRGVTLAKVSLSAYVGGRPTVSAFAAPSLVLPRDSRSPALHLVQYKRGATAVSLSSTHFQVGSSVVVDALDNDETGEDIATVVGRVDPHSGARMVLPGAKLTASTLRSAPVTLHRLASVAECAAWLALEQLEHQMLEITNAHLLKWKRPIVVTDAHVRYDRKHVTFFGWSQCDADDAKTVVGDLAKLFSVRVAYEDLASSSQEAGHSA